MTMQYGQTFFGFRRSIQSPARTSFLLSSQRGVEGILGGSPTETAR